MSQLFLGGHADLLQLNHVLFFPGSLRYCIIALFQSIGYT